jgi:hypothetical protein
VKKLLFIILLTLICLLSSQTFTDIEAELPGVAWSSVDWGDYDNDGDLDILLTGYYRNTLISKIYRNDGGITYTDINAGLTGVMNGCVVWGDYDNDGDLDILMCGRCTGFPEYEVTSIIYRNDSGEFNDINAGLTPVDEGSASWGDYDNDGDLDILLTGYSEGSPLTNIYRNVGNDIFTNVDLDYRLPRVSGSAEWGDYDNDGDLDIILSGDGGIHGLISFVLRNDSGVFGPVHWLDGVKDGSVTWGDYDNDGDLDILLTGNSDYGNISKIYTNNLGDFTDISADLIEVRQSSAFWGDYDNDGDLDILLTGSSGTGDISKIYRNDINITNTNPATPNNLRISNTDSTVTFSWDKATDNETPQDGLSYNLYIGTEPMSEDINTSMSDISNGYRKIVNIGNAGQNTSWTIKDLPVGNYYWSVQAIDHAFADEQSVYLMDLSTPNNVNIRYSDDAVNISWDSVPNATSYKIFVSDEPLGNYTDMTYTGTFYGMNWKQYVKPSSSKKFFHVVAVIE